MQAYFRKQDHAKYQEQALKKSSSIGREKGESLALPCENKNTPRCEEVGRSGQPIPKQRITHKVTGLHHAGIVGILDTPWVPPP